MNYVMPCLYNTVDRSRSQLYNVNIIMIKFALKCECSAKFEGWFPSNEDYENQLAQGQLLCPMCDSTKVSKDIMAPAVARKSNARKRGKARVKEMAGDQMVMGGQARTLLKQIQNHVEQNFENVGKNFAREARKAHKGKRDLEFYGNPSKKQVDDLVKDGIDLFQVPKVKDN